MEPFTRDEIYMAAAAGEYDGELPEPVTRSEFYWIEIIERINAGASVDPEEINAAIADYLNTHDADIVTEAELAEALAGYYNKGTVDNALAGKAAASHTHAQSDITGLATTLAGKAAASHTHTKSEITDLANATASSGGVGGSAGLLSPADKEKLDKMLVISEAAYEALNPPDSDTLYFVLEATS